VVRQCGVVDVDATVEATAALARGRPPGCL